MGFDSISVCDEHAEHILGRATRPMMGRIGKVRIRLYEGRSRSLDGPPDWEYLT